MPSPPSLGSAAGPLGWRWVAGGCQPVVRPLGHCIWLRRLARAHAQWLAQGARPDSVGRKSARKRFQRAVRSTSSFSHSGAYCL